MQTLVSDPSSERAPIRLAQGTELVGPYQGSGYTTPRYVVVRGDGQVVQVSELLYRIASTIDGRADSAELARRVTADTGEGLTGDQLNVLVRERLVPVGLVDAGTVEAADGHREQRPAEHRSDHLFMLRFRLPVLPSAVTWQIAGLFTWLHRPVAVLAVVVAVVALDVTVLAGGAVTAALAGAGDLIADPALVPAVLGLLLGAGAFHEAGHVSACRYGGARPGPMGVGIYLVWPAFYSTVTDSYRLSRLGRLRTDLGGVYFNAIVLAGLAATWLGTGADWVLVVVALLHLETARQFLPMIRLDGYYILSDLVGVPDLFSYLRPVLRSRLPGTRPDPRLAQLRPRVRRTVELWVAVVVPFLVVFIAGFLLAAPTVVPEILAGTRAHLGAAAAGLHDGAPTEALLGAVRAALLVLPVAGASLLVGLLATRLSAPLVRRLVTGPAAPDRAVGMLAGALLPVVLVGALAVIAAGQTAPVVPTGAGGRQIAALIALTGASVPAVGVLLGATTAVLLWPMCRRLGLPPPIAALAVVLAGAVSPLVALHATADPAAPAALWLLVAALLAGRGPAAARGAYLSCVLAAVTSPVAAVALAAFVAHGTGTGQLGPRLRPLGRRAVTVVATVLAAAGGGVLVGVAGATGDLEPATLALVASGGVLVALTTRFRRPLAPVGTAAAVLLLVLGVVPSAAAAAMLLLGPTLALLGAGLADRALDRSRPVRAHALLAAAALLVLAGSGPLVLAAADVPG